MIYELMDEYKTSETNRRSRQSAADGAEPAASHAGCSRNVVGAQLASGKPEREVDEGPGADPGGEKERGAWKDPTHRPAKSFKCCCRNNLGPA